MTSDTREEIFEAQLDVGGARSIVRFCGELDIAGLEGANQAVAAARAAGSEQWCWTCAG